MAAAIALGGCAADAGEAGEYDADALPPLVLAEEVRIGSVDDPDLGFSRITGVQVGEDGSVYVLEGQEREVRVYDGDGRFVRRIGRQGAGPGELQAATRFGLLADTVWVYDLQNQRITLFDPTGAVAATVPTLGVTIPVEMPGVTARVRPWEPLPDGRVASRLSVGVAVGGSVTDTFSAPALVFDRSGEVVDTVGRHSYTPTASGSVLMGGLALSVQNPWRDTPLRFEHAGDSVRIDRSVREGVAPEFRVTRVAAAGDTVYDRRYRYQPRTIAASAVDERVKAIMEPVAQIPVDQGALESAIRDVLVAPAHHPPVSSHRAGADGSMWLRRDDDGQEHWRWLVLRADGTPLGEVALPRDATVEWASGETAWIVDRDEFDVPWLIRYRLTDSDGA